MKIRSRIILTLLCALSLSACGFQNIREMENADPDIYAVYEEYVKNAKDEGKTPLSYEEWLKTIKGEKGDTGEKGDKGDKGDSGVGISSITKVKTEGDIDTYEIKLSNGTSYNFTVTNDSRSKTIIDTYLNENDHLIIVYSNGTSYDTGHVFELEEETTEDLFDYYLLDDGNYAVGAGRNRYLTSVAIPTEHNGKKVTTIAPNGFSDITMSNIVVPEGITHIRSKAFYYSTTETISLPDSLIYVENDFLTGPGPSPLVTNNYENCKYLGNEGNPYLVLWSNQTPSNQTIVIHPDCKIVASSFNSNNGEITFPEGVKTISSNISFNNETTTLRFPSTLKYLVANSTSYYTYGNGLVNIIYNGTRAQWDAIEKISYWDDTQNDKLTINCLA